jgi:ADP-ribose pyrophosphatase
VHHLIDVFTTIAFSNEKICIYYTTGITPTRQNLDEDEFVTTAHYSPEELTKMILKGEITDAKTVAAILAYRAKVGR